MKISKQMEAFADWYDPLDPKSPRDAIAYLYAIKEIKKQEALIKAIKAEAKSLAPNIIKAMRLVNWSSEKPEFSYTKKIKRKFHWDLDTSYGSSAFDFRVRLTYVQEDAAVDRISIVHRPAAADKDLALRTSLTRGKIDLTFEMLDVENSCLPNHVEHWKGKDAAKHKEIKGLLKRWKKDPEHYSSLYCSYTITLPCHKLVSLSELKNPSDALYKDIESSIMNAFRTSRNRWLLADTVEDLDYRLKRAFRNMYSDDDRQTGDRLRTLDEALKTTTLKRESLEVLADLLQDTSVLQWNSCIDIAGYFSDPLEVNRSGLWAHSSKLGRLKARLKEIVLGGLTEHRIYSRPTLQWIQDRLRDDSSIESLALDQLLHSILVNGGFNALTKSSDYADRPIRIENDPSAWWHDEPLHPKTLLNVILNPLINCGSFIKGKLSSVAEIYDVCYASRRRSPSVDLLLAYCNKDAMNRCVYNGADCNPDGDISGLDSNWEGSRTKLERRALVYAVVMDNEYTKLEPSKRAETERQAFIHNGVSTLDSFFNVGLLSALFMRNKGFNRVITVLNQITCDVLNQVNALSDMAREAKGTELRLPLEHLKPKQPQELTQEQLDESISFVIDNLDGLVDWYYAYRSYSELYIAEGKDKGYFKDYYETKLDTIRKKLQGTLDIFLSITSRAIGRHDDFDASQLAFDCNQRVERIMDFPTVFIGSDVPVVYQLIRSRLLLNHIYDQYLTGGRDRKYFVCLLQELDDFLLSINAELDQLECMKTDPEACLDSIDLND